MTKLEKLQKEEFKILKRIDAFCNKHNINYFLYSGTLLGAIRHKGFIPWDDDVDIAMLRTDFNKFDNLLASGTFDEEYFYYQSNRVQPFYLSEVVKVRSKTFNVSERVSKTQSGFYGPWVDIFPLDNVPDDQQLRVKQFREIDRINSVIDFFLRTSEKPNDTGFIKVFRKIIRIINETLYKGYFFLPYLFKNRYKLITKYNDIETAAVSSLSYMSFKNYAHYARCIIDKENLNEFIRIPFKGHKFLAPKEYHKILKYQYGDYMQKPKMIEREDHRLIFGDE